jgi:hypothetical protein
MRESLCLVHLLEFFIPLFFFKQIFVIKIYSNLKNLLETATRQQKSISNQNFVKQVKTTWISKKNQTFSV